MHGFSTKEPRTSEQLGVRGNLRMRLACAVILISTLLFGLTGSAIAQSQPTERAFVYGINAAIGKSYTGGFAPPTTRTIYLLANQTNIISPRITEIYFWPITNEYKANWNTVNESVPGTLEIRQNGQLLQQTAVTSYTIQYLPTPTGSEAQLMLGAEADAAQAHFRKMQLDYRDALAKNLEENKAWTAAMEEVNRRREAGETVEAPPEPIPPEPIKLVSNGINQGVPVRLPAGTYQIQLRRADGSIVAGSERTLIAFDARRSAVGYQVVPETRWTTPEQVDDLSDVILGKANSKIYLVPHYEQEYPARAYSLLENPQQQLAENSDWKWVLGDPIKDGKLEVLVDGQPVALHAFTPYRVQQLPGAALGYQMLEFTPDPTRPHAIPDLTAFPLQINQPGSSFEVRMRTADGSIIEGSTRLVRTPNTTPIWPLILIALCPLAGGATYILRRRVKMRLPRNVAG